MYKRIKHVYTGIAVMGIAAACALSVGAAEAFRSRLTPGAQPSDSVRQISDTGILTNNKILSSDMMSVLINASAGFDTGDDLPGTGKLEYSRGMAGLFEKFCSLDNGNETYRVIREDVEKIMKLEPEKVVSVISGYTRLGVSNTGRDYLNVRNKPSTSGKIAGKMPGYTACEIIGEENGWYKIRSGNVEGYVDARYIATEKEANALAKEKMETVAVVACDVLNVRTEPNVDCKVFTGVKKGEELEIKEELDGWIKVDINNLTGYVSRDYIEYVTKLPTAIKIEEVVVKKTQTTTTTKTTASNSVKNFASGDQSVSQKVKDLLDYAMQFLGNPYVSGGNSLTRGTDCSGFTKLIFAEFGYSLPRTVAGQVDLGRKVSYGEAKPGDLLFYRYGKSLGHVAIYIGNGKIVHASTPKGGIRIDNALYTTPAFVVRIIE